MLKLRAVAAPSTLLPLASFDEGATLMTEVERALEELANRFEMAGEAVWTSSQVADAIRRFAAYPEDPLTNRDEE